MPKNRVKLFDGLFKERLQLIMIRYAFIALLIFTLFGPISVQCKQPTIGLRYTLKDLEILRNDSDYDDFFLHVNDIRPSLRNNDWKNLVDEMAIGWATSMKTNQNFDLTQFKQMEDIFSLSPIKTNEHFKQLRNSLALKYFEKIFQSNEDLNANLSLIENFWKKDQTSFEAGLEILKLVFKQTNDIEKAWEFGATAFKSQQGAFYCQKKDLEPILFLKLAKSFEESALPPQKIIFKNLSADCWDQIKSKAKDYFFSYPQRIRGLLLTLLREEKLITNDEIDLYSFYYLMEGPVQGASMNLAWNTVSDLKSNKSRRDNVLERLQERPILPDGVLSNTDQERKKIIIQFVSKSFPEYFDFYARTCIQYLKGEIKYQEGNPTIHCRELFEMNKKNQELVTPVLRFQYEQSLKI